MVHAREQGPEAGDPVLLLHGQFADGAVWGELAARLAERRRVLAPDLPGNGRTPPLGVAWSPAAIHEALESLLAARGIGRLDVVGHSLGTYHAVALALRRRVEVRRLALLGPILGCDAGVAAALRGLAAGVRSGAVAPVEAMLDLAFPAAWAADHPAEMEVARRMLAQASPATVAEELDGLAGAEDLRPRLGALRAEVLVRVGSEDRNTPPAWGEAIARAVDGARLELVPGCGHLLLQQDRDATSSSVARFLGV